VLRQIVHFQRELVRFLLSDANLRAKLRVRVAKQVDLNRRRRHALSRKRHGEFRPAPPAERIARIHVRVCGDRQAMDERMPAAGQTTAGPPEHRASWMRTW